MVYLAELIPYRYRLSLWSSNRWFKNENHILWLEGEPWMCSPDLQTLAC
jgi:hypothetical protein